MSDIFTPADNAALNALVRKIDGLPDKWQHASQQTKDNWGNMTKGVQKDAEGNVIGIFLADMELRGSIDLSNLPEKLEQLLLHGNMLSGHLDLTKLPSTMKVLFLSANSFTTVRLPDNFPKSLERLDIAKNALRGVILKPASVEEFYASDNKDLVVCDTPEEYEQVVGEMTRAVRVLRLANSSTHDAHRAFKIYSVAQQTVNFLVNDLGDVDLIRDRDDASNGSEKKEEKAEEKKSSGCVVQ